MVFGLWVKHTVYGSLTAQLLKHLCGTSEPVTRFTNGDVEDEFRDAELPHGVGALVFAGVRLHQSAQYSGVVTMHRCAPLLVVVVDNCANVDTLDTRLGEIS